MNDKAFHKSLTRRFLKFFTKTHLDFPSHIKALFDNLWRMILDPSAQKVHRRRTHRILFISVQQRIDWKVIRITQSTLVWIHYPLFLHHLIDLKGVAAGGKRLYHGGFTNQWQTSLFRNCPNSTRKSRRKSLDKASGTSVYQERSICQTRIEKKIKTRTNTGKENTSHFLPSISTKSRKTRESIYQIQY